MIVFRLCRSTYSATPLDGEGARLYGGRWNPKGLRMVYAASSLSLATLESFVHFSSAILPRNYVQIAIEIPDALAVETWGLGDLPADWMETPAPSTLQDMGREWLLSKRTAVLRVPSAVIPDETNVLVNPEHPDAVRIVARAPAPFAFDQRLIKPGAPSPASRTKRKRKTP